MNRWGKIGIVLGGYVLAMVVSTVAVAIYDTRFTAHDNQTMGGMIAGGEMLYGGGVFVLASLLPTGLALWFLRRHRPSWSVFSIVCVAFSIVGLVAALLFTNQAVAARVPMFELLGLFGIVQMLGSPVWIAGMGLFAWLAPARDLRQRMLVAM